MAQAHPETAEQRRSMVEHHLARRGVRDTAVLDAMRSVPREAFLPERLKGFAYEDSALPIEAQQTISQPYIVGLMIEAAELTPDSVVLEIGAGSGYAAAVMAEIAAEVVTIERHAELAGLARQRLSALGYANVEVIEGDGTLGRPDRAPYDAIIAAAGGHAPPRTWIEQLKVGGRLVMPVGDQPRRQTLLKYVKQQDGSLRTEDLGEVMFVPLIGEHGWTEEEKRPAETRSFRAPALPELIAQSAEPFDDLEGEAFAALFDRFADRKVVLLGEASHGTSEFYRARAAITRRLIEQHGFTIVALEADWPDAAAIDRHVRHAPHLAGEHAPFNRFPTWMWRNREFSDFAHWLRTRNAGLAPEKRAGIYGLDIYNFSASIEAVLAYLDRVDPEAAAVARERYGCLTPWQKNPEVYGRAALSRGYGACESAVSEQLADLLQRRLDYAKADGELFLDAAQNARLIASAERYYRIMYYGGAESWNLRDTHMFETLVHLLNAKGPGAKAVVWAHNSHIGDAAFTEMGVVREELNLGQLARERYGRQSARIGFSTHAGSVMCASDWGGPMEVKPVRPSMAGSIERLCHESGEARFLLDLSEGVHEPLRGRLMQPRLERFIGVIYRPETELMSHYAEASLSRQFDALVWFDRTSAVTPLTTRVEPGVAETYPFGV